MAKNHNRKPAKRKDPMELATTVFLAGCFAEMYLLMVRRYYVNGNANQVLAWFAALPIIALFGAGILCIGALLAKKWKPNKKKRSYAAWTAGIGAFLMISSALIRISMSFLTLLTTLVPVAMLLVLIWLLYDRECALTLTILSTALIMLWLCRRLAGSTTLGTALMLLGAGYILLVVVLTVLVKQGKLPLLKPSDDTLPVYVGAGLSVVTVAVSLFSTTLAYYAMWALAAVVFALAVYYTVKQL